MILEETPRFWWRHPGWQSWLLAPVSWIYGWVAEKRMAGDAKSISKVPVICVGNFIVGGAGKTPTVELLANHLKRKKMKPGILTRGYGGAICNPTIVKPNIHNSHDVGDEALLHAAYAMTVVSEERMCGADLLVENGCDIIIMDDGFQTPSLAKDFCLVVVDAKRGIGNGFAIPAGPVRVPIAEQLRQADAVLLIGTGEPGERFIRRCARAGKPVFKARVKLRKHSALRHKKVIAFAGLADPEKFYDSLQAARIKIVDRQSFGDHHCYTQEECNDLLQLAQAKKATLVTTTKDAARLKGMGQAADKLLENSVTLPIILEPEDPAMLARFANATHKRFMKRKLECVK